MPTPYKVFLSVPDDPTSEPFLGAARTALWRMDQMMISAISSMDILKSGDDRILLAKQAMETTALFIGIYGKNYGNIPTGQSISFAEQEYRLAYQRGIVCVIFMTEEARTSTDPYLAHLKELLMMRHIIHYFKDLDDLQDQIIVEVHNFLQTNRQYRLMPQQQYLQPAPAPIPQSSELIVPAPAPIPQPSAPITPAAAPQPASNPENIPVERQRMPPAPSATITPAAVSTPAPSAPLDLESLVEDALRFASDDIEQIVRRSLQVWDAQKSIQKRKEQDGLIKINPIFGEPSTQSQFQSDVFMIMPFRDEYNTVYQNIIRPVVSSLNLTMKRGDDFNSVTGVIMQEVWAAINGCKVVIVETTEINANVYYELGIAHTLGKPAILLTQTKEIEHIPFDVRHLRFIVYENTITGGEKLSKDLKNAIVWLMNDLKEIKANEAEQA
jgi:hypothetical protein